MPQGGLAAPTSHSETEEISFHCGFSFSSLQIHANNEASIHRSASPTLTHNCIPTSFQGSTIKAMEGFPELDLTGYESNSPHLPSNTQSAASRSTEFLQPEQMKTEFVEGQTCDLDEDYGWIDMDDGDVD